MPVRSTHEEIALAAENAYYGASKNANIQGDVSQKGKKAKKQPYMTGDQP